MLSEIFFVFLSEALKVSSTLHLLRTAELVVFVVHVVSANCEM